LYKPVKFPGGIERPLTGIEQGWLKTFMKWLNGDMRAGEMIVDRTEGKPFQMTGIFGGGKEPLNIVFPTLTVEQFRKEDNVQVQDGEEEKK
jgi:hypothetical protein